MRVLRFQIVIGAESAAGYTVHVLSPRGEGWGRFVPPASPEPETPAARGEELFKALFQGEILRLYERSVDLLEANPEAKLRIEIVLDARLTELQQLPWELLRQPGTPEALALSRRRPLVRYLAVPRPVYAACRPAVLRILAVAANPRETCPLDLARELDQLRKAVGSSRDGVRVEVVEPEAPTLAGLRRALLEKECHVLHFMGHGGALPGWEERVLVFADEHGGPDPVRGTDLANKLADFPALRLAVLNACGAPATSFDPFTGMATSLVLGGLPAVVAMRLPISDAAAIAFSGTFYERLAAGDPVDAAVAEGRQAVHSAAPAGFEWATPALFMRTPNGELYPERDLLPDGPPPRRPWLLLLAALLAVALAVLAWRAVAFWRVERLVDDGVAFSQHGQWQEARKRFLAAVKLAPGSAEVHSDLAGAEEKNGYYWAAEQHYRMAARLEPRSAEHRYNLGYFLNSEERYGEAFRELGSAASLDPSRPDTHGELAAAALGLKMLDQARDSLRIALRLDPERPAFHRLLGELDLAAGRPGAAIGHLKAARDRYPPGDRGGVQTASLLVDAYDRSGDALETCRAVAEYRRLDRRATTPWAPQVAAAAARRGCPAEAP